MLEFPYSWQLDVHAEAFIFDCDGTLTALEGIDELARMNGVGVAVEQLTATAMGQSGLNIELYEKRLALVKPTQEQVDQLGEKYIAHCMPNIVDVISILESLNKKIHIVSAGLYPAVAALGNYLKIPRENIHAVDIYFDGNNYRDFDRDSPLVNNSGKRTVIEHIGKTYSRLVHIGDGMNDYSAHDLVSRFIGYGGAFYHHRVAEACQYYIKSPSMTALLPLSLTQDEYESLDEMGQEFYEQGLMEITAGRVIIQ